MRLTGPQCLPFAVAALFAFSGVRAQTILPKPTAGASPAAPSARVTPVAASAPAAALGAVSPVSGTGASASAANRQRPVYPLEVELLHGLNARNLRPEAPVEVRLETDWNDGVCTVPKKTVLPGRVVQREEKDGRFGSVAIRFEYQCEAWKTPQRLLWMAVLAPEMYDILDTHGKTVTKQTFRSSSFGEGDLSRDSGVKSGDMSGRSNPSLPLFIDNISDRHGLRPTSIELGEVWHLPRLELSAGTGPEGSSVLSSPEKQVKLPGHAVLVLMPERLIRKQAAAPRAVEQAKTAVAPLP